MSLRPNRLCAMRVLSACALLVAVTFANVADAGFVATLHVKNANPVVTDGNFGTVTVDDSVANQVTITFAYNPNINNGQDRFQKIAFNTNLDLTASGVTITQPDNWSMDFDPDGVTGMNGFGAFDVGFSASGNADRLSIVTIVIQATGITAENFRFTSVGGNPPEAPAYFAAHYIPGGPGGQTYKVGSTDLLDELNPTPAPPSVILALIGLGVIGSGYLVRRKRAPIG